MTIKRSGIISLADIQNEFGGTAPISISEYYRSGAYTTANNIPVPTTGFVSINQFYGASKYTPGNTGIIWSGNRSVILPPNSGNTIYYYCIGGGGGGGGGSSRIGYGYGAGGGGGSGGNSYGSFSANPGDNLYVVIGGGGHGGAARDGPYSSGSSGGWGGRSIIYKNWTPQVIANGGSGGTVAQHGTEHIAVWDSNAGDNGGWSNVITISPNVTPGGSMGTISAGSYVRAGDAGQYGQNGICWSVGGVGGRGFFIIASPRTIWSGSYGSGGIGYYNGYGSSRNAVSGTGWGAGGSGGGAMVNANSPTFNGSAGQQGAVLMWW